MIKLTQEFETEKEARLALSGSLYHTCLFDLDEYLRAKIKYGGENMTDEQEEIYDAIRIKLRDTMDFYGVNLMDYE